MTFGLKDHRDHLYVAAHFLLDGIQKNDPELVVGALQAIFATMKALEPQPKPKDE